MRRYSRMNRS